MRIELKFGLFFVSTAILLSRFPSLESPVIEFLSGCCIGLGIFAMIVTLLPKFTYNNLFYRKWLSGKNKKN